MLYNPVCDGGRTRFVTVHPAGITTVQAERRHHMAEIRYTDQTCHLCDAIDRNSRRGRIFACIARGHIYHADHNAVHNIEKLGMNTYGMPHVYTKGRLDAEGSCAGILMNYPAPFRCAATKCSHALV